MLSIAIFTYSTKPRGSVVHAAGLAEALTRAGHDATVYALGKSANELYRPLACAVQIIPAREAPADTEALIRQRIGEFVDGFRQREMRHDIFHAQDCLAANALLASAPRRLSPMVRTVHHVERFQNAYLAACQRRSILEAAAVFSVSRLTQREVLAEFGRPSEIVRNGVDTTRFVTAPAERCERLRARFGVGPTDLVVLSVGGVEPRKNTRRALAAVARVSGDCPPFFWLIVGDHAIWDHSEYTAAFEADLARAPGDLSKRVVRTGTLDDADMSAIYALSDVLLCPSEQEGFGLCVLEAMAAGTPVLVPGRDPFTEYLDAASATFVESHSVDDIARGLQSLLVDSELRARQALAAQLRAPGYCWQQSADMHIAHYESILLRS